MFYIDLDTKTTDKFDMAKFLDFSNDGVFDVLNSFMLYQIPRLPEVGIYTVRTKEENRPDLLSHILYQDTQYWWVIMWYNSILNPYDLKTGTKIKYPSLSAIQQLYMDGSLLQKTV